MKYLFILILALLFTSCEYDTTSASSATDTKSSGEKLSCKVEPVYYFLKPCGDGEMDTWFSEGKTLTHLEDLSDGMLFAEFPFIIVREGQVIDPNDPQAAQYCNENYRKFEGIAFGSVCDKQDRQVSGFEHAFLSCMHDVFKSKYMTGLFPSLETISKQASEFAEEYTERIKECEKSDNFFECAYTHCGSYL